MKNFLINDYQSRSSLKRGGHLVKLSIESDMAEKWYEESVCNHLSPDLLFDLQWMRALLHSAEVRLRDEYQESGKNAVFEQLSPALDKKDTLLSYESVANTLKCSPGLVRVLVHRMRKRHHAILKELILETLASEDELTDETAYLASLF